MPPSPQPSQLLGPLLAWYGAHQRTLPWRDIADPYAVWVSEVMLQQTQVATAEPYFKRFMARFPTLADLAAAPLADVLSLWQGLGYYARARHLHEAAQVIARHHGGQLPATAAALQRLPGIGRYTAGAIASIAFGEAVPAVDGNVKRVIARLEAVEDNLSTSAGENRIWDEAARLQNELHTLRHEGRPVTTRLKDDGPGDLNQALIELGALICTPRHPACDGCPLAAHCQAFGAGRQHDLPARRRPRPPRVATCFALIMRRRDGRQLIAKRPPRGLLGGLWEYPLLSLQPSFTTSALSAPRQLAPIEHVFSHVRLTITPLMIEVDQADSVASVPFSIPSLSQGVSEASPAYAGDTTPAEPSPGVPDVYESWDWVTPSELAARPVSTLMQKLVNHTDHARGSP